MNRVGQLGPVAVVDPIRDVARQVLQHVRVPAAAREAVQRLAEAGLVGCGDLRHLGLRGDGPGLAQQSAQLSGARRVA